MADKERDPKILERWKRRRQNKKKRFWMGVYHAMRRRVLLGLVTVVPIMVAVFVCWFLVDKTYDFSKPFLERLWDTDLDAQQNFYINLGLRALSVVLLFSLLYMIGLLSGTFIVRQIIRIGETIVEYIPGVKSIYRGSKQLVETISMQSMASFSEVVLVEYPRKDAWVVAFVTGHTRISNTGQEYVNLFVPTTPNPTSGFMVMLDPTEIQSTNLTIEEGVKFVMSAGIVIPADLKTIRYDQRHKLKKHEPTDEASERLQAPIS